MTDNPAPLLEMRGISKAFTGVRALADVDLTLHEGEVLGLIGENGAGKSTLMKVLGGIHPPDAGEIRMRGEPVRFGSANEAIAAGVSLIHQELNLAERLSVSANILLGREPRGRRRSPFLDLRAERETARALCSDFGLDADPGETVADLPPGQRQMVEILKALSRNARVLVMDEPTSSLSRGEGERLFDAIGRLKAWGVGIIYISHRLDEVLAVSDRIVCLRDGRRVGELPRAGADAGRLASLMVGREIRAFYSRSHVRSDAVRLKVESLSPPWFPAPVSFEVRRGEILGLAGLVGSGRTETLRALFGLDRAEGGTVSLDGERIGIRHPVEAVRAGMGYVPEDRREQGAIVRMAVCENVTLPSLALAFPLGSRRPRWERESAREAVRTFGIHTPSIDREVQYLSGGNQQKVVLAKWLMLGPRVLLLDEPTRGIDVGAKAEIYGLIDGLCSRGIAVAMASSEMEEVLGISDRILVFRNRRIAGALEKEAFSEEALMRLATGAAP